MECHKGLDQCSSCEKHMWKWRYMNLQNVRLRAVDDTTVVFESRETFTTAILSEKQGNKNTKMNIEEEGEKGIYEEDDEWTGQKLTWKKGVCCIKDLHETNPNVLSFCRWLLQAERHHALASSANLVWFSSHTFFLKFSLECVMIR